MSEESPVGQFASLGNLPSKPPKYDTLFWGDCLELMPNIQSKSVDLVFADPPFNIGYEYDCYRDNLESEAYMTWCRAWLSQVYRVLKPQGTFWLAMRDEYAAEMKVICTRESGLHLRSWVIWYYTFGVNSRKGFSRSHTHLFQFVKDKNKFTFNTDVIRVPSARQLVYDDIRANPAGRLPDNTWILRPQESTNLFGPDEDTWHIPRVCGSFRERSGWHGCQMPEQVMGRIVLASSNEGEVVLDPFAGTGTTLAVAKKLNRRYLGFELSEGYAFHTACRLAGAEAGQPLAGGVLTPQAKKKKRRDPKPETGEQNDQASGDSASDGSESPEAVQGPEQPATPGAEGPPDLETLTQTGAGTWFTIP